MSPVGVKSEGQQDDEFDGQLILSFDKGVRSSGVDAFFNEDKRYKRTGLVIPDFPGYPPISFLGRSQKVPVPLRITADLLSTALFNKDPIEAGMLLTPMIKANQREILDIISDGKIRISILLNSLGGYGEVGFPVLDLFRHVKSGGGVVDAYVSSFALSMAAVLFGEADNRFVLNGSLVMWHAGRPNPKMQPFMEHLMGPMDTPERRKESLDSYRAYFSHLIERLVIPEKRSEILDALDKRCEDVDGRGDMYFSSSKLSDCGVVTESFLNLQEMENFFVKKTGLSPDCLFNKRGFINRFFSISAFEEYVRAYCSISAKFEEGTDEDIERYDEEYGKRNGVEWMIPGVYSKSDVPFSVNKGRHEDSYELSKSFRSIPDYDRPDFAGHVLRLARDDGKKTAY